MTQTVSPVADDQQAQGYPNGGNSSPNHHPFSLKMLTRIIHFIPLHIISIYENMHIHCLQTSHQKKKPLFNPSWFMWTVTVIHYITYELLVWTSV